MERFAAGFQGQKPSHQGRSRKRHYGAVPGRASAEYRLAIQPGSEQHQIRKFTCRLGHDLPPTHESLQVGEKYCCPHQDLIEVTETRAEIPVQEVLNLTCRRLGAIKTPHKDAYKVSGGRLPAIHFRGDEDRFSCCSAVVLHMKHFQENFVSVRALTTLQMGLRWQ